MRRLSEEVQSIVFAFSDKERKDAVRELAKRVAVLEETIAAVDRKNIFKCPLCELEIHTADCGVQKGLLAAGLAPHPRTRMTRFGPVTR